LQRFAIRGADVDRPNLEIPSQIDGEPVDVVIIKSLGFVRHAGVLYVRILCPLKPRGPYKPRRTK
jgi:hypothetical protein